MTDWTVSEKLGRVLRENQKQTEELKNIARALNKIIVILERDKNRRM